MVDVPGKSLYSAPIRAGTRSRCLATEDTISDGMSARTCPGDVFFRPAIGYPSVLVGSDRRAVACARRASAASIDLWPLPRSRGVVVSSSSLPAPRAFAGLRQNENRGFALVPLSWLEYKIRRVRSSIRQRKPRRAVSNTSCASRHIRSTRRAVSVWTYMGDAKELQPPFRKNYRLGSTFLSLRNALFVDVPRTATPGMARGRPRVRSHPNYPPRDYELRE